MIVPVTKENEKSWAELCSALWPDAEASAFLEKRASGNLPYEYLYLLEGVAVAFISLSLRHDYVEGTETSPVAYLEGIFVKPEHRNKGIGRKLIEFSKTWALEKGCTELASDCKLGNTISEAFHKNIGFQETKRIIFLKMDLKTRESDHE